MCFPARKQKARKNIITTEELAYSRSHAWRPEQKGSRGVANAVAVNYFLIFYLFTFYRFSLPSLPPHIPSAASGRRRSIVRTAGRASMFMGVKSNLWKQMVFVRLLYR